MWKEINWLAFLTWAKGKTAVSEKGFDTVHITFDDGAEAKITSAWSGPYSDVTPDIDPEPPIVKVKEAP